jgi:tetratricopeptide (TPR) repeat protein
MSGIATTLRSLLDHADALFEAGRIPGARAAYEELLERSQERTDRSMEVVARSMLARCLLRRKDIDGAREELDQAARHLEPGHAEAHARWQATGARIAIAQGDDVETALRHYLEWAEGADAWPQAVDACQLLAERADGDGRLMWYQRAVDLALEHDVADAIGRTHSDLAGALESQDRIEEALDAWEQALHAYEKQGSPRQLVSSAWAAGTLAVRLEDWPLAQSRLDTAIRAAEGTDDCVDLLALALAELARIHEASGDVIEARRVFLRALRLAAEQDLPRLWPERWASMREQAKRLELDA